MPTIQETSGSNFVAAPSGAGASAGAYGLSARGSLDAGGPVDLQGLAEHASGHVLRAPTSMPQQVNLSPDEVQAQYLAVLEQVNRAQDKIRVYMKQAATKSQINMQKASYESLEKADDAARKKFEGVVNKLIMTGVGAGVSAAGGVAQMATASKAAKVGELARAGKKGGLEAQLEAQGFEAKAARLNAEGDRKIADAKAIEDKGEVGHHTLRNEGFKLKTEATEWTQKARENHAYVDHQEESAAKLHGDESRLHSQASVFQPAIVASNQVFDSAGGMSQATSEQQASLDQNEAGRWEVAKLLWEHLLQMYGGGEQQALTQQAATVDTSDRLAREVREIRV